MKKNEESKRMSHTQMIFELRDLLLKRLTQIKTFDGVCDARFLEGENTAYLECLETIQRLDRDCEFGLDFDLEKAFPIKIERTV